MNITLWMRFILLSLLFYGARSKHSRYRSEMNLIKCLCTSSTYYRLQKIECMERYVSPYNTFRMSQSIQYCGYFAYKTNFGQTMRQQIRIENYNPWEPSPDLNTDKICSFTRIQPDQPLYLPVHRAVTGKGWVISRCILDMSRLDAVSSKAMIQVRRKPFTRIM